MQAPSLQCSRMHTTGLSACGQLEKEQYTLHLFQHLLEVLPDVGLCSWGPDTRTHTYQSLASYIRGSNT